MADPDVARLRGMISDAAIDGVEWTDVLRRITQECRSERTNFIVLEKDGVHQTTYPYDPEGLAIYASEYAERDVRLKRILDRNLIGMIDTLDLMSPEEVSRCPVHQQFYRLYPECWHTGFHVTRYSGLFHLVVGHRSAIRGPLDPDARAILSAVAPDLARAWSLSRQRRTIAFGADDLVAMFDAFPDGIIVLDTHVRVLHMNAAAEALCRSKDLLLSLSGVVTTADKRLRAAFGGAINAFHAHLRDEAFPVPDPILLPRGGSRRQYRIAFFSAANRGNRYGVLQVSHHEPNTMPDVDEIAEATPLSKAEAQVARLLMEGETIRAIADLRGVSEHTVQTQVRHIREKMEVPRQAAAVTAIMRACGRL